MLTVTDKVLKQFDKAITKAADSEDDNRCLRIVRGQDSNLSLALEPPAPDDTTYDFEGRTVLAVPEVYSDFCADKTLDMNEDGKLVLG
ncbi:MAG: hypothetical protein ACREQ8_14365 [Woeseiaceae bacterium]